MVIIVDMFIRQISIEKFQQNRPLSLTLSPKEKGDRAVDSMRFVPFLSLVKSLSLGEGFRERSR